MSTMHFINMAIDLDKLPTQQELLDILIRDGANDNTLAGFRERFQNEFGNELMWRYPISDGMHAGTMIVVVRDGFLSLPYDEIDKEDYELFLPQEASMFDDESFHYFIEDFRSFSDDLLEALEEMQRIVRGK